MGATGSCFPRYGCCVPKHSYARDDVAYSSTPKGKKSHRRNLSAAFHLTDLDDIEANLEQMNVNVATEEELMTLPGVNRLVAHNIIEYRNKISGFKKVEDLALVSGVGATKLSALRAEICISSKKSSINSSVNSSHQDLSMQDNGSKTSTKSQKSSQSFYQKMNINTSNVFQLMKVKGISQQVAENIVSYRDRKGPFRSLDELVKVKGVKPLLSAISPHLVLYDSGHSQNGGAKVNATSQFSSSLMGSQETLCSLYGPLGRRSHRKMKRIPSGKIKQTVRVASWNLQNCSTEKTDNFGVKEVVAMTMLENDIGIIAVQDLKDKESLAKLCDELNNPVIPNVKKWEGSRGAWQSVTSENCSGLYQKAEHLGFLYNKEAGIELKDALLLQSLEDVERKPYIAVFQLHSYDVVLVNVHLVNKDVASEDASGSQQPLNLDALLRSVNDHLSGEKDVIILGSFQGYPDSGSFGSLREQGYSQVFHEDQYTDISPENPEGKKNHDNIWLGSHASNYATGNADVVRDGLTSPWIPHGWGWGGVVSGHCPVWVELYTTTMNTNIPAGRATGGVRKTEDLKISIKPTVLEEASF